MDWTAQVDAYCERLDPGFWAEPLNAITNLAFLVAAAVMGWRLRGQGLNAGWLMVAVLALIGLSSGAWHTLAVGWTGAADSLSILVFILVYLYAANRDFWGLSVPPALLGTLAFLPAAAIAGWAFARLPFFGVSAAYWPVALLIGGTAVALRRRTPETARNLGLGAVLLCLSISLRSLDDMLCPAVPIGTHFLWHLLNALLLGWMIETWRRHRTSDT